MLKPIGNLRKQVCYPLSVSAIGSSVLKLWTEGRCPAAWLGLSVSAIGSSVLKRIFTTCQPTAKILSVSAIGSSVLKPTIAQPAAPDGKLSVSAIGSSVLKRGRRRSASALWRPFSIRHRIECAETPRYVRAWKRFFLSVSAIGSSVLKLHVGVCAEHVHDLSVSAIGSSVLKQIYRHDSAQCDPLSVSAIGSSVLKQPATLITIAIALCFQYPPSDRVC